jgi:hypothetical protein
MKKILLFVLMFSLVFIELYLCTAFLPLDWQHRIDDSIPDILPRSHDMTPITHPLLRQEIEQALQENVGLRIAQYAITIALVAANTWLIYVAWRLFRATQRPSENR